MFLFTNARSARQENMNPAIVFLGTCLLSVGMAQRSQYAPKPVGTLQVLDQYTPAPAAGAVDTPNRFGGVDENYAGPLQPAAGVMGDPYLLPHLPEWPREHQPFWYLNSQHIMNHRGQVQPAASGQGGQAAQAAQGGQAAQAAQGGLGVQGSQGIQGQQGLGQQGIQGQQGLGQQGIQGQQGLGQQGIQGQQGLGQQGIQGQQGFQGQQGIQGQQGNQRGQSFQGQRGQGFQGQRGQGFQGQRGFQGQQGQGFQNNQRFQGSGINSRLGDTETIVLGSQQHRTPLVKNRVDRPEVGTQFRGPQ